MFKGVLGHLKRFNIKWWLLGKWRHHYREWQSANAEIRRKYPTVYNVCRAVKPEQKALVCYLLRPFLPDYSQEEARQHSNHWRVRQLVELLNEFGFEVDVTDYRNHDAPDGRNYKLVIGLDVGFYSACGQLGKKNDVMKILLGTGAHTEQVARAEKARLSALYRRRGYKLKRRSRTRQDKGPGIADAIFVVGNEWVKNTYRERSTARIFEMPNTIIPGLTSTIANKDFRQARKRFLWLASYAAVHRGLDLLLEVFAKLPEFELYVCGSIKHERDFIDVYRNELNNLPNIHFGGWIDVTSDQFAKLTEKCAYLIYPSASDGMPGSVVNGMAAGLIPVVTLESGMDTGGYGKLIPVCTLEAIRSLVMELGEANPLELKHEAEALVEFARSRFSKKEFVKVLRSNFREVLGTRDNLG